MDKTDKAAKRVEASVRRVAYMMLTALDDAVRVVDYQDSTSMRMIEDWSDYLKPALKWAYRYGKWPLGEEWDDENTELGELEP